MIYFSDITAHKQHLLNCKLVNTASSIIYTNMYKVLRAEADWALILLSVTSCESEKSPAKKNACGPLKPVGHTVHFFQ
jgi:hypothetical protein